MHALSEFIGTHYNVLHPNLAPEEDDYSKSRIFLLAEWHPEKTTSPEKHACAVTSRKTNDLFISTFFSGGKDVLLLEGVNSLQEAPLAHAKTFVASPAESFSKILGWDAQNPFLEGGRVAYRVALHLLDESTAEMFSTVWKALHKPSGEVDVAMDPFLKAKYEAELAITHAIEEHLAPHWAKKSETFSAWRKEICKEKPDTELIELQQQLMDSYEDQAKASLRLFLVKGLHKTFHGDFPERTMAMVRALETTTELVATTGGRVLLIAGALHLREAPPSGSPEKDALFSLAPLRAFFKGREDVVVLEPKCLSSSVPLSLTS